MPLAAHSMHSPEAMVCVAGHQAPATGALAKPGRRRAASDQAAFAVCTHLTTLSRAADPWTGSRAVTRKRQADSKGSADAGTLLLLSAHRSRSGDALQSSRFNCVLYSFCLPT